MMRQVTKIIVAAVTPGALSLPEYLQTDDEGFTFYFNRRILTCK